jgi:hypothetical protein
LTTADFYGFASNQVVKEKAIEALRKYGVGPCSAPNFYGTQDIHLETEARIASFLGTESCIVYSYAFVTASSMISSFVKRRDIIVADEACNYSIRKGLQISRGKIHWYKHKDLEDLELKLQKVVKDGANKILTRRSIATEGMFENIGDVPDLSKIVHNLCFVYLTTTPMLIWISGGSQIQVPTPVDPRRLGPLVSWAERDAVSQRLRTLTLSISACCPEACQVRCREVVASAQALETSPNTKGSTRPRTAFQQRFQPCSPPVRVHQSTYWKSIRAS